ncbi:MAG TPA: histidine kinase [Gemmatimonadaceae bacterium]|nr:histidine kinase [Gemmatimonadaceae bacterium]
MDPIPLVGSATRPLVGDRVPGWLRAILAIPLEQKVLGANLLIVLTAWIVLTSPLIGARMVATDMVVLLGALVMGALTSYLLIRLALKPVKALEHIARRVSLGRVNERVPGSVIADPDLAHLAATMNDMLDNLVAGRKKMASLAAEVVYAQERERAQVARDLHESLGQTLAAANFQLTAAANQEDVAAMRVRLATARELLRTSLEELRNLSRSLHPRVADDLGLPMALQALADRARQRSLINVNVVSDLGGVEIPRALSTTFYRIAEEALRNVEARADAGNALISLSAHKGNLELEVSDDGCAIDDTATAKANVVLANMRRRLSLAGGQLHIDSTPDEGTRVLATVTFDTDGQGEDAA